MRKKAQTLTSSGFQASNNSCPQCGHSPFGESVVKPGNAMRRTIKSWLKDHKTKAEKPATVPSTGDSTNEDPAQVAQVAVDASQDTNLNGENPEQPEREEESSANQLPTEEQPMPSIEVREHRHITSNATDDL